MSPTAFRTANNGKPTWNFCSPCADSSQPASDPQSASATSVCNDDLSISQSEFFSDQKTILRALSWLGRDVMKTTNYHSRQATTTSPLYTLERHLIEEQ
jgi:hypothetical protein